MLIASSINGFLFALVSGQPLLILGPTGPFLVFEEMVYDVSVNGSSRMCSHDRCLGLPLVEYRLLDRSMLC